jgi:hypothetical protein
LFLNHETIAIVNSDQSRSSTVYLNAMTIAKKVVRRSSLGRISLEKEASKIMLSLDVFAALSVGMKHRGTNRSAWYRHLCGAKGPTRSQPFGAKRGVAALTGPAGCGCGRCRLLDRLLEALRDAERCATCQKADEPGLRAPIRTTRSPCVQKLRIAAIF